MFKNYLKTTFRFLFRHKGYLAINIAGLSIGIACSILIMLFVRHETSYDKFHEKSGQIFRVAVDAMIGNTKIDQAWTPAVLPETMKLEFPEVLEASTVTLHNSVRILYNNKTYSEDNVFFADQSFLRIFSFKLLQGNRETALDKPDKILLSKSMAKKYFGDEDPVGKSLHIYDMDYQISGIIQDAPDNSHFHYSSIASVTSQSNYSSKEWFANNFRTYVLLKKGADYHRLDEKFPTFVEKYLYKGKEASEGNFWKYYLQPLTEIHLTSDLKGEFEPNGNKTYVYMFSVISIIILLLACINFMNLTTARSVNRAREIGIRKVAGSRKTQLIAQFLSESVLITFLSAVFAIILLVLILPSYNNFIGKSLSIDLTNIKVLSGLILLIVGVGLLSGAYPALFLSSFRPALVLKGTLSGRAKNSIIRNTLVVFQFAISVFLIMGTITVHRQLEFIQNNRLGFNKEEVLVIKNAPMLGGSAESFKQSILKNRAIKNVTFSHTLPGRHHNNWGMKPENSNSITLNICGVDEDFLSTMQMEMKEGRFFSKDFPTDTSAIIINEATVKLLDWKKPLGKTIYIFGSTRYPRRVIGVVKDYHYESMRQKVRPMALLKLGGHFLRPEYISVRLKTDDVSATLGQIRKSWNEFAPGMPYEYSFLDEDYDMLYKNERQTGNVFAVFSALAIFLASMGLFGMASYLAEQKTREIGIRKVLGASFANISLGLSKEFLKWPFFAVLIAWPAGWFVMNKWLENFAFRISIGIDIYLGAMVLALTIALLTISYQSIKSSVLNPVDAIKNE